MKILFTGACGVTSRSILRSLLKSERYRDLEFVGTDVADNPFGLFEGLYKRIYKAPHVNDPSYGSWMQEICDREKPDAAILIPELEVCYWAERGFPVPALLPPPKFSRVVISKRRLYQELDGTGLVPEFHIVDRENLLSGNFEANWPMWLRDFSDGVTSGKGSFLAYNSEEARIWTQLNPKIDQFMVAGYLPGGNYACHLLFHKGKVVKSASYERLEYFMARTAISGITGNLCKGRLLHDEKLLEASERAIRTIAERTGEEMNGIFAVDLKGGADGVPRITEINLRYVAAAYAFAVAGFNLAEAHLSLILGRPQDIGPATCNFPPNNMILRDIDGTLIWRPDYTPLQAGEYVEQTAPNVFEVKR